MITPQDDADDGHFGALATWLDEVKKVLQRTEVVLLTVEDADLPGALQAVVRPDRQGIATSLRLIGWAKPDIALLVSPDEDEASFELYVDGDERVVIVCGPALPRPSRTRYGGLDPADRERIEQRLSEIAAAMFKDGDPSWEPVHADAGVLVDAYFTEYDASDNRATVEEVLDGPPMRAVLRHLQDDRTMEHMRVCRPRRSRSPNPCSTAMTGRC